MQLTFYLAAAVAVAATVMVITRVHIVQALLYFIVSLLAVAIMLYLLGAPFVAVLEVIIYAGAIVVLLVFVVMMLNLGRAAEAQERQWLQPRMWVGPALLACVLMGELLYVLSQATSQPTQAIVIGPKLVSLTLFGPYIIGVELAAMLLLAGLVGAYHLGQRRSVASERPDTPAAAAPYPEALPVQGEAGGNNHVLEETTLKGGVP